MTLPTRPAIVGGLDPLDLHTLNHIPPQAWLLDQAIPQGIVCLLVARGGMGKSFFLLDMAIALALGAPFLGKTTSKSKVLYLAGEDSKDQLGRRLNAILERSKASKGMIHDLVQSLFVVSLEGKSSALLTINGDTYSTTDCFEDISHFVKTNGIDVLMIDPLSRFYQLNENDNSQATRFIEVLESLKHNPSMTILCAHHTSKDAMTETHHQGSLRGASAFADGARHVMTLERLVLNAWCKSKQGQYKSTPLPIADAIAYRTVKSNYAKLNALADYYCLEDGVPIYNKDRERVLRQRVKEAVDAHAKRLDQPDAIAYVLDKDGQAQYYGKPIVRNNASAGRRQAIDQEATQRAMRDGL